MIRVNKKIKVIVYLTILSLFLWILFAFNTDNADYAAYAKWYRLIGQGSGQDRFEVGYTISMIISNKLGLNFQQFLMFYSGIGIFLIAQSVYIYCRYPCLAILLYFIYPFFFDVVQIRNFMAEAIIFFAIRYLEKFSVKNVIFYLLFVLLAFSFHKTSIVALLYMMAYFKDYLLSVKLSVIAAFFGVILFQFIPFEETYLLLESLVSVGYLEEGSTVTKVLGYGIIAMIIITSVYLFYFKYNKKKIEENNFLIYIVPSLIVFCFFVALSSQGYRFFRNMMLIVYTSIINIGVEKKESIIKFNIGQLILSFVAIGVAMFLFGRQLSWRAPLYETVTEPIIKSNSLLFGD